MDWWQRIFYDERAYHLLEGGPSEAIAKRQTDFVAETINLHPGMRILDVGCGRGWLSSGLATRGAIVTAIDASPLMASYMQPIIASTPGISFNQIDFYDLAYDSQFDAVICWGNGLGNGDRREDHNAIQRFIQALVPGGIILLDLHNSVFYRKHTLGKSWQETKQYFILEHSTFDNGDRRLMIRSVVIPKTGGPPEEYEYRLLHYEPDEIKDLLESTGVIDITFYGDADTSREGSMFTVQGWNDRSHCMIVFGRKQSG